MKTEFASFCDTSLARLKPLRPALRTAVEQIEKAADPELMAAPLAALNDLRARLRSLTEKLESQQAYLLIFGPLKSGKSTLMNAISGAYVSEVSSLPGYPCLVFVRHSEQPHFSVTRYNGRESAFADGDVLRDVIADSHIALAQQIRATESTGAAFDPRTHFSEAIRRVDVKISIPNLAESSTVLVDTPGLYSRMNFGYDVLTREFRDSAACAVFVVKTDNLFLEQVFEEFNQLLDLFSRIFLVINVDSGKRDLQPDGTLRPSAESQHPEHVIEAFKTLSMAAPLRRAYEEGRVRIHAVDLMNAAASFLSRTHGGTPAPDPQRAAFDDFIRDLADYVNSSDYTVAFMSDSLRQGSQLCAEARAVCAGPEIETLRHRQTALAEEMAALDERIGAVDRLLEVDWPGAFEKAGAENTAAVIASAKVRAREASKEMRAVLDRWQGSADSVRSLAHQGWSPVLAAAARSLAEESRERLRTQVATPTGGAEPASAVMTDLHLAGFDLAPVSRQAAAKLEEKDSAEPYRMEIEAGDIPVKKFFVDWILFRTADNVRRRVLGRDLEVELDPESKARRLPEPSRDAFISIIDRAINARFPALPENYSGALLSGYAEAFHEAALAGLVRARAQLVKHRAGRQLPFDANARIVNATEDLQKRADVVQDSLVELATPPLKVSS